MGVPDSEKLTYQPEVGRARIHLWLEGKPVWLTQGQMAELLQNSTQDTSLHIRNNFSEGELQEDSVGKEYVTTAAGGKRYRTKRYHLGVIIAVGYRVRMHRGTQLRRWTTERLFRALFPDFFFAKCNKSRYSSYSKPAEPLPSMLNSGGPFFFREPAMTYTKAALTIEELADKLLARGLVADRSALINRLKAVNYYRLSGYLYPFRNPDDTYRSGTTLDVVWQRYTFDRQLRLLALDGIEHVEVSVRTALVYHHAHKHGPFGYTVPANVPKLPAHRFGRFLTTVEKETQRSHEVFVEHFQKKYGDQHGYLPLWMVAEIMPFGTMLTLFDGVEPAIKRTIAAEYDVPDVVRHACLGTLNVVRNICAHHGRLWNRQLGFRPKFPNARKYPEWHTPVAIPNDRVFAILTILKYMLVYAAPQSQWPCRLRALLDASPDVPQYQMGFPPNWESSTLWRF